MLERRYIGDLPAKPHTVFKPKGGKEASEYVFTRDGFAGGFSILYMDDAPTAVIGNEFYQGDTTRLVGETIPTSELPLARRHIETWRAPVGKNLIDARTALYRNSSCRASVVRGSVHGGDFSFCNGDGDELWFIYAGSGTLLTMFGRLPFRQNDYILIPRSVPYVIEHQGEIEGFIIEGDPQVQVPQDFRNPHGQLKMEAPYIHRDFRSPVELLSRADLKRFDRSLTLKNGRVSEHRYAKSPAQVIGWDGSVYPMTFNILDYLPKTGKVHLPPNMHLTFASRGFVVCSFIPRLVDYGEGAVPCPYPHSNVHCDEILYYVRGNFTSRAGIKERSLSFHPMGMPHGPQPGKYLESVGTKNTDELAVMLDTFEPLQVTKAAMGLEDASYSLSWV